MKHLLTVLFILLTSYSFANISDSSFVNKNDSITNTYSNKTNAGKIIFKEDLFAFGVGAIGQSYGLLIAMMDGSGNATHARNVVYTGMATGLVIWTITAVSTSVVIVPIIYGVIYILPTIGVISVYVSSALDNINFNRSIAAVQQFQSSKEKSILSDSSLINKQNVISYSELPKHLKKHIYHPSEKDSILDIHMFHFNNKKFYTIETRNNLGLIYQYSKKMNMWIGDSQDGHRIEYYNNKGHYVGTRWLNK